MGKKKKKWLKFRHRVIRFIAYYTVGTFIRLKYHIKIEKQKDSKRRPYLILLNHQTPGDQFFAGMSFARPVYYLATEDLFSNGWVSKLLCWAVAPISIKKQTVDIPAVMNCIRVAKEGGTICIAPEGNRTYSGKTEYMNPSIAALAKKIGLPIALYRIEGGWGVEPRWSDVTRKGKMRAYVSRVIEPEEAAAMTNEQLFAAIKQELTVNEACADHLFDHKKRAEYIERVLYVCPDCGLTTFESENSTFRCLKCGRKAVYEPTTELTGVDAPLPFRFVNDWYEYQKDFMNALDLSLYEQQPMYRETTDLYEVIINQKKNKLRTGASVALYGNRIVIDEGKENELSLPFTELSAVTVLGRNKLNLYHGQTVYQFKGFKRFNALKYVHTFYRYKNMTKGESDGTQFLGL